MIELSKKFVPSTDEVWRLQRGTDPECIFFQKMAEQGHYGGNPGSSRQGIYVCAPSGEFLASINSNDPDRVLQMMKQGLAAWQSLPNNKRQLTEKGTVTPKHRWEDSYPEDGLVLNVISRDLPEKCDPSLPCETKWNQDYVWFSKTESREWLGSKPQLGDVQDLPEPLVNRLARLHFVDNVKGQTNRFRSDGVEGSKISTKVVGIAKSIVTLEIAGDTRAIAPENWWQSANGVVTKLQGFAKFDMQKEQFVEFEIVALGRRWGQTRFNGRRRDPQSGPLGFVLRLADQDAPRIAPAWISHYQADWVRMPSNP